MKSSHSCVLAVCLFALALAVYAIRVDNSEIVSSRKIASFNDIQIGMTPDNIETIGFNDEFRFFSDRRMSARGYRAKDDASNVIVLVYRRDSSGVFRVSEKQLVPYLQEETDTTDVDDLPPGSLFAN